MKSRLTNNNNKSVLYYCLLGAVTINGKFMDIYISEGSNEPEHILEKSSMPEEADKDLFGEYYLVGMYIIILVRTCYLLYSYINNTDDKSLIYKVI